MLTIPDVHCWTRELKKKISVSNQNNPFEGAPFTVEDVVKGVITINSESVRDSLDTFWTKSTWCWEWASEARELSAGKRITFGVDICDLDDCTGWAGWKVITVKEKKITFPSAPPISTGSWATTLIVCASCVLPVRNSPYTTVWIMSSYWLLILNDPCSPSLIDWVWNPPVIESESKSQEELHTNSPPRIASTDLLPVLMNCTVCRFSWTSRPVANEDP